MIIQGKNQFDSLFKKPIKNEKAIITYISIFTLLTTFSSCAVVGGIFKAGMGFGIFIVVLIIAATIFIVSRMGICSSNKK